MQSAIIIKLGYCKLQFIKSTKYLHQCLAHSQPLKVFPPFIESYAFSHPPRNCNNHESLYNFCHVKGEWPYTLFHCCIDCDWVNLLLLKKQDPLSYS